MVVLALSSTARAEDEVNLLGAVPSVVAVSSTVDNAAIVPEHLVDGKLDTAWNSRTGELAGAWIAFRVPATAHVSTIKLTAGFTKQDKRLGDLFVENHRVKRVEVTHDGKSLGTFPLDIANRGLQDIKIDAAGGDYTIRIAEMQPGTKKDWREAAISELEVWGTLPPGTQAKSSKPLVRVGSLDVDCVKTLFPQAHANKLADDDYAADSDWAPLATDLAACSVRHGSRDSFSGETVVALVRLGAKPSVIAKLPPVEVVNVRDDPGGAGKTGKVSVDPFTLDRETALLVRVSQEAHGPMYSEASTKSALYRVGKGSLSRVLEFESKVVGGETEDSDQCELRVSQLRDAAPPDLAVDCVKIDESHGEDGYHRTETRRTESYGWKGGRYVRK